MSRPLRIEFPDAWYHVMNRGRCDEDIFSDEQDYLMFTELLKETSEMWNIRIAAFCLLRINRNKLWADLTPLLFLTFFHLRAISS